MSLAGKENYMPTEAQTQAANSSAPPVQFEILGHSVHQPMRKLETFPTPPNVARVTLKSAELTSICPITSQPDFSTVDIAFAPDKLCLESKSLKLYLWSYRNEGAFCEALASQIAQDVFDTLQPHWCTVTINQAVRGGIAIEAEATVSREQGGAA
jgi:7-cyano-7-deazaguanine reductase